MNDSNQTEYGPDDLRGWEPDEELGEPGSYPYTRGPYPSMYTGRLWTMRQYAGFGDAKATNERFRSLLDAGQTGLSVAFDLPTQMGLDSDDEMAAGEVGKVGVAIDSIEDMRVLFDRIPLGDVTTSMTINSTAAILLLLYQPAETSNASALGRQGQDILEFVQHDHGTVPRRQHVEDTVQRLGPVPGARLETDRQQVRRRVNGDGGSQGRQRLQQVQNARVLSLRLEHRMSQAL